MFIILFSASDISGNVIDESKREINHFNKDNHTQYSEESENRKYLVKAHQIRHDIIQGRGKLAGISRILIIGQESHKERSYRVEQVGDVVNEVGRIEHVKQSFQAV